MRPLAVLLSVLVLSVSEPALAFDCRTEGMPAAKKVALDEVDYQASLMVNTGVWLTVLNNKGLESLLTRGDYCSRANFTAGFDNYHLGGETEAPIARVARTSSSGRPVAYIFTVPDLQKAMQPDAPRNSDGALMLTTLAFALVTAHAGTHTVWRYYDDVPVDELLMKDMREALLGELTPVVRWEKGKISYILGGDTRQTH